MTTLMLHSNPTAQWHALVNEAQVAADRQLGTDLESYLVFVLMRFVDRPDLAGRVLALDFLHGALASGGVRQTRLRDVGDQCLLYSGLFPEQAEHRHVSVHYFVDLGRTAYQELATRIEYGNAELFTRLARGFVTLTDVLLAMRTLGARPGDSHPRGLLRSRGADGQSGLNRFVDTLNSSRIKPH